jgi:hypothetical protein
MSDANFILAGRISYAKDDPSKPGKPWASIRVCVDIPGGDTGFGQVDPHRMFLNLSYKPEDLTKPYFQVIRNRLAPDVYAAIWGSVKVGKAQEGRPPRLFLDAPWRNLVLSTQRVPYVNKVTIAGRYHAPLGDQGFVVKTSSRNPKTNEWKDSLFPVAWGEPLVKKTNDTAILTGRVFGLMPDTKQETTWLAADWVM